IHGREESQEGGEHLQLAGGTVEGRRKHAEEIERALQQAHRLAVRVYLLRRSHCALIPRDRLTDCARALVVAGDLAAHRSGIVSVDLLEGARHMEMVMAALRRAQGEVGDLTDLVVTEVVSVSALLVNDATAPQFIQTTNE